MPEQIQDSEDPPVPGGEPGRETHASPAEEPEEQEPGFAADMGRLFLIPAVIVGLSVLVFLLFGWIAGERRSAEDYLQEVRHGVTERKWQAAFELSRLLTRDEAARRDPAVAKALAETMRDPGVKDPRVRRYLVLALQQIEAPAATDILRNALDDEDPEVRLYAARAVGARRDEASVPRLTEMLSDEDPGLRKMALHALGRIGDPQAAGPMRARLDDPVEDVRWNAALALAMLGDGSGAGVIRKMVDPSYLDTVEGITEAQKIEARVNAVQAAFLLGGPEMRALVESVGSDDSSLRVRDAALKALEEWPD